MLTTALNFRQERVENATFSVNTVKLQKLNTWLNMCAQIETACETTQVQVNFPLKEERVEIAKMKVENKPIELVTTVGSCVAICLYDFSNRCGGLAHIMLPKSGIASQDCLPAKFADTAVPALVHAVRKISGDKTCLSAKIAGGANLFSNLSNNGPNIGAKNVEAVKAALCANKIELVAEDVGGPYGRRIAFNIGNGVATVRLSNGAIKKL